MNLSFGYYHESEGSSTIDGELYELLSRARAKGCVVVCSACFRVGEDLPGVVDGLADLVG